MSRQQQERAQEQQQQSLERQREAAQQAQERQQEQIKQSQEQAREQQTERAQRAPVGLSQSDRHNDGDGKPNSGADEKETNDLRKAKESSDDESSPPATVEQWLKRIVKPAALEKITAGKTEQKPREAKPRVGGQAPSIEIPDAARPEVLAVNASKQSIERAKSLGFKLKEATSLASLEFAVTRLLPPEGMSAMDARTLLNKELPQSNFGINQKYRIYRTATGTGANQLDASSSAQPVGQPACGADHCFGSSLIQWKPELRGCASGLRVGLIDTSVDVRHPAFTHKQLEVGRLGRDGGREPDWHGTGVTALLAGDPSSGTPGLIPDANFYIADIFYADTDNLPASDTLSMLRAFDWLEARDVKIVNMSLSGPPDGLVNQAIEKLSAKGVLFVAAAGNEGPAAPPSYPAAYDNVIAVTAVDKDMKSYRHANRGTYIDVAAPGVSIWTALPRSMEGYHSGTSFAVPYVTAALAAIYKQLPTKTSAEALKRFTFKDLGAAGYDPIYGRGLLVAPQSCGADQVAGIPRQQRNSPDDAQKVSRAAGEQFPWLSLQTGH